MSVLLSSQFGSTLIQDRICSLGSKLFLVRLDPFWNGHVIQASKKKDTKVVSLCIIDRKHGGLPIHLKFFDKEHIKVKMWKFCALLWHRNVLIVGPGYKQTSPEVDKYHHQALLHRTLWPGRIAQSIGLLTCKSGVLGSIPVWQHTFVSPSAFSRRAVVSYWRKYVREVLVNRLGGLSLPRKSVVKLTDRPDMTLDVYRGHKTTIQQQQHRML